MYHHTVTPVAIAERAGKTVVTTEMAGNFPGSQGCGSASDRDEAQDRSVSGLVCLMLVQFGR